MRQLTYIYKTACTFCLGAMLYACSAPEKQVPQPTKGQQAMIDRKYGFFLNFVFNIYFNVDGCAGPAPDSNYAPPAYMQ